MLSVTAEALLKLCSGNGFACWTAGGSEPGKCPLIDARGYVQQQDCYQQLRFVCRTKGEYNANRYSLRLAFREASVPLAPIPWTRAPRGTSRSSACTVRQHQAAVSRLRPWHVSSPFDFAAGLCTAPGPSALALRAFSTGQTAHALCGPARVHPPVTRMPVAVHPYLLGTGCRTGTATPRSII